MSVTDHDRLRNIKRFDQLVVYLRDELDWPIDEDDFDELTFDYKPEELGLDPKITAKIKNNTIKQLRPLKSGQPFGIFFIEFEPKSLPVTALRRILGRLVTKKRATASQSSQQTWAKDDLLFVSAYGQDEHRRIDFAHFADDAANSLPTLRVLGWDRDDTTLTTDWVDQTLREKLAWCDGESNDEWRERWRSAFVLRHREVITTSKMLAKRLAELARDIRSRVNDSLSIESDKGPLTTLMTAFKETLIHDLNPDDFADMYAQTIAYGLLSARISRPAGLVADNLVDMVPITNPFLKELMETFLNVGGRKWSSDKGELVGIDFDELGVNDVVDTLRATNMEAVLRDFDNRNPQEDPVIHFYELFLKEYDAKKRMQRGVFYTPKPVVSYIVRSVHELLQTEFGLEDGLADTTTWGEMLQTHPDLKLPLKKEKNPLAKDDEPEEYIDPATPFVQILDPATGTATFLVEVIDIIHQTMVTKWKKEGHPDLWIDQKWNEYVPKHLLPRLHGYELMMAPYAIAHMKIGLKLYETGYTFDADQRARIYLTNALEPAQDFSDTFEQMAPALAHEAQAVNDVKRHQRFTVVIGNPPYSKSMNNSPCSLALVDDFKKNLNEKKSDLNREEWKFLRLGYRIVESPAVGIIGVVINNAFLTAPTHRGIRRFLLEHASKLRVVDLHGDSKKGEISPDGEPEENVFEIQQGVCIAVGVVSSQDRSMDTITKSDLFGRRKKKYHLLFERSTIEDSAQTFVPDSPFFFFRDEQSDDAVIYRRWIALPDWFTNSNTGIQTKNDNLFTDIDAAVLQERMYDIFANVGQDRDAICAKYNLKDSAGWRVSKLSGITYDATSIKHFLYKPFDHRFIYYHTMALGRARHSTMQHMLGANVGLVATRQVTRLPYCHAFVSRWPIEEKTGSHDRTTQLFPLYLYESDGQFRSNTGRSSSLAPAVMEMVTSMFRRDLCGSATDSPHIDGHGPRPEDVFHYIYAILYSPHYRETFGNELLGDFARIPLPDRANLLHELSELGANMVAFHLLESPLLDKPITTYTGPSNPEMEKVSYTPEDQTVWLDKAQTIGFVGVPEDVWNFHIGGYQVCHKWLKDRQKKGGKNPRPARVLTDDDLTHYQKIIVALNETIRLMKEIDEVIEEHGGWPDAFVTDANNLSDSPETDPNESG